MARVRASATDLIALGRDAEALPALERAREARDALIKANPSLVRNRDQLIGVLGSMAGIHLRAGRKGDALASLERAREVAEGLAADHPDDLDFQVRVAEVEIQLADLLGSTGRSSDASAWLDRARTIVLKVVAKALSERHSGSSQADLLRHVGGALWKCGRPAEAASALRESVGIFRSRAELKAADLYNVACSLSVLSGVAAEAGSGLTADEGRATADEAMTTLRRAVAAGWRDPYWLMADPELAPIRSRRDFRLLISDLSFPDDPFARIE